MLHQGGIRSVTYEHDYRDTAGITFLKQSGIDVHQYTNEL
jgi:deoxycytidylate deaminase